MKHKEVRNVLLAEPQFPIPSKSRNHANFLPIGLLKLASFHRAQDREVRLVRGNCETDFDPQLICITSLFTYWSRYVHESVSFYGRLYPQARIQVGGIYATLMPEHCASSGCDEVVTGVQEEAERYDPAYDLVDVDYQIIHGMRGCPRRCPFCGTWRIEPEPKYKASILKEIRSNRLIFYDNNLLANPNCKAMLREIADFRFNDRVVSCESQSGFDGRLLDDEKAELLKAARFRNPRIAWDGPADEFDKVRGQVETLERAGYARGDIEVFMVYNHDLPFLEMEKKRESCLDMGVQISDCRFRPLDQLDDRYDSRADHQGPDAYWIHPEWTDTRVRLFRRRVREQNICVRMRFEKYDGEREKEAKRLRDRERRLASRGR